MSDTIASLRRKIATAGDLQSVVRAMKAFAASNVGQYERSLQALSDYYRIVELGLATCFRGSEPAASGTERGGRADAKTIGAVVFGSDQGLVGRFNEVVVEEAVRALDAPSRKGGTVELWAVGERVQARLTNAGLSVTGVFALPNSVRAIAPLVGQILLEGETRHDVAELHLFYNRPTSGAGYAPVQERLLPLDEDWRRKLVELPWPTKHVLPEVVGDGTTTLRALIREHLFVSLFRACAESLASENASRLAAMERADKNIKELQENLDGLFHRLRQSGIDEELFDVVAGFEAQAKGSSVERS